MKLQIIFLMIFMLLISGVNAITTDLKENYMKSETAIVEISGYLSEPLSNSDFKLKRNNVNVPVKFDLKNVNGKNYVWFIVPSEENNYTFILENVEKYNNGFLNIEDYKKDFKVINETIDYNIDPGFIISKTDFEISVKSNFDGMKEIEVNSLENGSFLLKPGINIIKFSAKSFGEVFIGKIKIGKYDVPAYISNYKSEENYKNVSFNPKSVKIIRLKENNVPVKIYLRNYENYKIENLSVVYDENLFLVNPNQRIGVNGNSTFELNLTLLSAQNISGRIDLIGIGRVESLYVDGKITNNDSQIGTSFSNEENQNYYCVELNGKVCLPEEVCKGERKDSLDGMCCVGSCVIEKNGGYSWIGYVMIILVFAIVGYVWFKYKKAESK